MTTCFGKNLNKNSFYGISLMLLFVFTLFSPFQKVLAQNITSREEAKSIIESSIQEASKAIEDNKKLREERKKYIKTTQVAVPSYGGGYTPPATDEATAPGQEAQLKEIDTKIANNDATIKTNKENAEKASKYLKKNFSNDIEKDENETYEELISTGFNETGNGEMEPCWSLTGGIAWSACVMTAGSWIASIIIYFFGGFLYIAGALFDASIMVSIEWLSSIFQADYISAAWKVVRDFANIFFIFILLYIAVGTIFDLNGIGSPQKMVVNVIIIALLVNFSGFFVRVVVDATNIIAYEFYSSAKGDSDNIGSSIVTKLIPEGYLVDKNAKLEGKPYFKGTSILNIFLTTIISIIIILVTCFVLITASILFIIRTIILIFIYIISPFAFMSQIIPNKNFDYFTQWKNALTKQSLYAPGFLIPLYLVVLLLNGDLLGGRLAQMDGGVVDTLFSGALMAILNGLLGIGLIISCIFIAQKFGAVGLGLATAMGAKFTQGSSQIMGRYGGRAARAIGNRVPGSQALRNSWNEGALSRSFIRRSWDTGVLRTARDSGAGQVIGQAVRNPLFSAGAGIGFMANQVGVRGMDNITGQRTFGENVTRRAQRSVTDIRNMERPADQARYLEGLRAEELEATYRILTPQERQRIEAAATTSNRTELAQRLRQQRGGLTGSQAQQTAVAQIQNNRAPGANIQAVEHLNQEDLNQVIENLTPTQRNQLRTAIQQQGNQALLANFNTAITSLSGGNQRQTNMEAERLARFEALRNNLAQAATPNRGNIDALREIRPQELERFIDEEVNIFDGNHQYLYPFLTVDQLRSMQSRIGYTERQEIRNAVINMRGQNPHPDRGVEQAYQFLTDPTRGGINF